jgi:hypothetical protein
MDSAMDSSHNCQLQFALHGLRSMEHLVLRLQRAGLRGLPIVIFGGNCQGNSKDIHCGPLRLILSSYGMVAVLSRTLLWLSVRFMTIDNLTDWISVRMIRVCSQASVVL